MTHVLFITPYYPPEKGAAMVRVSETAKRLVQRGYEVTVLTTVPNYPTGIVPPEYRGHAIQREMRDGVHLVRVWSYSSPNTSFLGRIVPQLSFACTAPLLGGKVVGHPDIIIVQSPPLFDAIAGRILSWYKRCPFIFLVSDLWPENAVQLGMLRNRLLIRLSEWLEWSTYKRARAVWALTEGIRDNLIKRGLPPERVFLLTNGVDTSRFRPLPQAQARHKLGWDDRFTVLYVGTHGVNQGLIVGLDAAEKLRDRADIRFVLAGDGAEKAHLIAEANRRDLRNVIFLDALPNDQVPVLLAGADVCLVPLRKAPLLLGALPAKMFEIMACARPIILGVDGEARRLAEQEAGAAIYVEPESAAALASAILHLRERPDLAMQMGQRGRACVEARFDRDQLVAALDARIAILLGKNAPLSVPLTPAAISTRTTPIPESIQAEDVQVY
jgi:colanic acid biosynthesis glycosyl transferase WcaI